MASSGARRSSASSAAARDRLADAAAHAAADEGEVHRGEHDRAAADRRGPVERALAGPRLALRLREPLRVRLRVGEAERVERLDLRRELDEAALVEQLLEPLADRQAEVVVALRADAEVALEALVVDEGVAGRALRPLRRLGRRLSGRRPSAAVRSRGVAGARPARRRARPRSCRASGAGRSPAPKTLATTNASTSVVRPMRSTRVASTARSSARAPALPPQLRLDHPVVGVAPRGRARRRRRAATGTTRRRPPAGRGRG